jgi:PhnB protein
MGHPIPPGHHVLTPHLVIKGAADAIDFYKRAFGAKELSRMSMPGSEKIGHAELQFGDSKLFLADEFPDYGSIAPGSSSPVTIHFYSTDADATFAQAVQAGATVSMPLMDAPWGDRFGKLIDPYGHHWSISEHLEDLTPEQIEERMAKAFGGKSCE